MIRPNALLALACPLLAATLLTSCTKPTRIAVGATSSTQQLILAEIIAQHLEHRLGDSARIDRRIGTGDVASLHQTLLSGDVDVYAEDTGILLTQVLHETAIPEPAVALTFVRTEMKRRYMVDVLDPFGLDDRTVIVVPASFGIHSLEQAGGLPGEKNQIRWKLGSTLEFVTRDGGLKALAPYHLTIDSSSRTVKVRELFNLLQKGEANMLATQASDAHLPSPEWTVLDDPQNVFLPRQTTLLIRQEMSTKVPMLRPALAELAGKISLDTMRKLRTEVDIDEKKPADVARAFLQSAGLK
ncbi:MAG: glycine betaine ABC transporter substrate-binding protein [Acidobacteriota bacterium]